MMKRLKHKEGFTLIELIVVMGIISVLSSIAMPAYNRYGEKAKIARAKAELKGIQTALETLAVDTEKWPGPSDIDTVIVGSHNEVWDLNSPQAGLVTTNGAFPNWSGPYLKSIPKDPWGNNYFFDSDYTIDGEQYVVIGSFGPNGVGPNVYDADDVILILPAR